MTAVTAHPTWVFDILDSTNEEAKRKVHQGKVTGLCSVLAFEQTAGKGTQGRQWVSPPNAGLYLTVIHPHQEHRPIPPTPLFTLAAGVAAVQCLERLFQLEVRLKPVNDLFVKGKKLGGILTETLIQEGQVQALITGIGINILSVPRLLSDRALAATAEAVALEDVLPSGLWQHREPQSLTLELAQALIPAIDHWHQQIFDGQTKAVQEAWRVHQLAGTALPF